MTELTTGVKAQEKSVWNPDFIILMILNIIVNLGYQMLSTSLAKYAATIGIPGVIVGVIVGMMSAAALVSRPFGGFFADRFSKKSLMTLSLVMLAICFAGYVVIRNAYGLIVLRFVHGIFFGLNTTLTMAMVSDTLPPSRISSGLGYFSISGVASTAIAPSVGIWIADCWGYSMFFIINAAITVVGLIFSLRLMIRPAVKPKVRTIFNISSFFAIEALVPSLVGMLISSTYGVCGTYLVLFGDERSIKNIGAFFTVYAAVLLFIRPLISKVADRINTIKVIMPCCFFIAISMVELSYSRTLLHVLLGAVLFSIGFSALPLLQSMSITAVTAERRGVASSTYYMGIDIGNSVGPVIGGILTVAIGYHNTFFCFAFPAVAAGTILLLLDLKRRKNALCSK